MSEHSLPPDASSWPRDPFRLLGVAPGVSARDLRKSYLRLIRSFKPEHSPEEFKRIRDAYESILPFTRRLESIGDFPLIEEEGNGPRFLKPEVVDPPMAKPPEADRRETAPDPWLLACRGEPEAAYRALVERQDRGLAGEEVHLQLYWLLSLLPDVDRARSPGDWLVRGLKGGDSNVSRLRELLRREMASDSSLAISDRVAAFLHRGTTPSLTLEVVEARWRAARASWRWSQILADLNTVRTWMPEADAEAWARVLLVAASNLAWAESPHGDHAWAFAREVEQIGTRSSDHADELYQLEYVQVVKSGLDRLGGREGPFGGMYRLLSLSWDEHGPEFRSRFRSYVEQIARDPIAAVECLDQIQAQAPAVLGRLSALLRVDDEEHRFRGPGCHAEIAPSIDRFLASTTWDDYRALRPDLLRFCLREATSPGLVARTLAERPEFILTGKSPLSHAIREDWPLRQVYRACELGW